MSVKRFLEMLTSPDSSELNDFLYGIGLYLLYRPILMIAVIISLMALVYWILAINVITQDWFVSDRERLYRIERAARGNPVSLIPAEKGLEYLKKACIITLIACPFFLCHLLWVSYSEYGEQAAAAPSVVASPAAPAVAPSVRPARKARKSRKALRPAIVPVESPKP